MGWLVALLTAAFNAVLNAFVRGFSDRAQDADRVSTHERSAVNQAANETSEAINETVATRADIGDMPDVPDELARELRRRKSAASRGQRSGRRPF